MGEPQHHCLPLFSEGNERSILLQPLWLSVALEEDGSVAAAAVFPFAKHPGVNCLNARHESKIDKEICSNMMMVAQGPGTMRASKSTKPTECYIHSVFSRLPSTDKNLQKPRTTNGIPQPLPSMSHNTTQPYNSNLTSGEIFWVEHQSLLLSRGYQLRPRYNPAWTPSWTGRSMPKEYCEDSLHHLVRFINLKLWSTRIDHSASRDLTLSTLDGQQMVPKSYSSESLQAALKFRYCQHCQHKYTGTAAIERFLYLT